MGVPDGAGAFSFNLYEHTDSYAVELVGFPGYSPDDPDGAREEVFAHRDPLFELPHALVGATWQQGLDAVLQLVRSYVRSLPAEHPLQKAQAVAVGFVDGDLHVVWPETAAPA